jgi:hypothetical protein
LQRFFFFLPKPRVLIPAFLATETSEYQVHTKFQLSGNRRNSKFRVKMNYCVQIRYFFHALRISWNFFRKVKKNRTILFYGVRISDRTTIETLGMNHSLSIEKVWVGFQKKISGSIIGDHNTFLWEIFWIYLMSLQKCKFYATYFQTYNDFCLWWNQKVCRFLRRFQWLIYFSNFITCHRYLFRNILTNPPKK